MKSMGTSSKSTTSSTNIGLSVDGNLIFKTQKVAEIFHSCFTWVGSSLQNVVDKPPRSSASFCIDLVNSLYNYVGVLESSFKLEIIGEDQVLKIIRGLAVSKATGLDGTSARFLKDRAVHLAPIISHIINLPIRSGEMPKSLEMARAVSLYKKGNKNY